MRLTSNLKPANEMPARQRKQAKEELAQKGNIQNVEGQQFFNNAERLEHLHKMQEKKFINFPCNSGLSGQVFTTGELKVCNEAEKETAFVDEIDNQPKVRNVRNFMIGPVYGEDKKLPVGVI